MNRMWRIALLSAVVFCLSLAGLILGHVVLTASAEEVVVTETERSGDPSAAAGLSVSYRTDLNRKLVWETTLQPAAGPESAVTRWSFYPGGVLTSFRQGIPGGLRLHDSLYLSGGFRPGVTLEELEESPEYGDLAGPLALWAAAAAETPAGTEQTHILKLRDYYEFFPFHFGLEAGGKVSGLWEQQNFEKCRDFFRIPVPAELELRVRIRKDPADRITELECAPVEMEEGPGSSRAVGPAGTGVAAADFCYYTFDNSGVLSGPFDTSYIPGGYGIYALPYTRDSQGVAMADADDLFLARSLDPAETVLVMSLDQLGRVLLFTWREGTLYLNVYLPDAALTEVQRVALCAMPEADTYLGLVRMEEDRAFCLNPGERLLVAELGEGDLWRPALELRNLSLPEFGYGTEYAWDGERLAVASALRDEDFQDAGFTVAVYDREGLRFTAACRSSLTDPEPPSYRSRVESSGPWPLTLRWEQSGASTHK